MRAEEILLNLLTYLPPPVSKCWAQLGRQGGTQAVNLGEPECITTQTVRWRHGN